MKAIEVKLSDIIIQNPDIDSFPKLLDAVKNMTSDDMLFLNFDVKPDYRDTPKNWQWKIEAALGAGGK